MTHPTIRKAALQDALAVQTLLKQLGYDVAREDLEKNLCAATRNDELYVAVLAGEVVGLISFVFFDYLPTLQKFCRIVSLVVLEESRGSGVGTALIAYAQAEAKQRECAQLELTTALHRVQAHGYYESIGFTRASYKYIKEIGQ